MRDERLKKLLVELGFTEQNTVHAATRQAKLFSIAAEYRVEKMRNKNEAKAQLDLLQAQIAIRIHEREGKITEQKVKYLVIKNRKYQEALAAFNFATEEDKMADLLLEAYDQRLWSLKIVSNATGMEQAVEKQLKKRAEEIEDFDRRIKKKYREDEE